MNEHFKAVGIQILDGVFRLYPKKAYQSKRNIWSDLQTIEDVTITDQTDKNFIWIRGNIVEEGFRNQFDGLIYHENKEKLSHIEDQWIHETMKRKWLIGKNRKVYYLEGYWREKKRIPVEYKIFNRNLFIIA